MNKQEQEGEILKIPAPFWLIAEVPVDGDTDGKVII